ncbi:mucin-5AC-like [Paramacrobiotus metropolitanus]|uniref:mucin-5AC-like n=1 Tax=Paramacrobiotus metropolitanus TaxID=2943436 RepID=UPI002445F391|nr:mucin-5AC-like [Paramacrobiotus metropolitanus]
MANMVVIRYFWIFMIIISQLVFIRCDIASTRDAVAASAAEVLNHPAINHQSTNDSLVMIASSPQERDGLLSDVVTPLWKNLAGSKSQDIKLSIISDKPWITSVTPDGKAVRFVTYLANISSYEPLDLENIRRQFREEVVRQKLPYVWAVPDNDNNTILLSVTGTTTPTSPLAGNTSENANIFPLQSAAINTTGNAIKSQPDSYATTTATTGAASVSRRRRRRTTAANGGATEAPNPFINFTVPADWAGNDMLNQMKTTWPGLALFSNESLPNGYVEFSFRNPNVTSPSVDQATLVTNALSESTTPATSLQQVTSGPLAVGSSEASTSLTTVSGEQVTTRWSRRARHTTLPASVAQVTVAPQNTGTNINFSVPADWPGNDVLHQLKSAWPGAASFSNDTNAVPNGTVLFSFGDHNATTGPSAVGDLSVPTTTPAGSFLTTKRKRIRVGGFAASSGFTGPLGSGASAMAGGFRTNDNPLISNYTGDFGSDIVPVGGEMNQIMSTSEAPLVPTTLEAGLPSASTTAAPSTTGRGAQKVTTPRRPSPMDNNSPIAFESNPNPLVSDYTGDYRSDIEPVTVSSHDALGSTVTFGPPDEQGMQIVAFNIGDITIVSVENTKQRDEVLNKQLKPLWQNALGPNVSNVELSIDSETPVPSKNGTKARQISYSAQGTSDTPVPVDQVRDQFHQEVAKANLPNVLAVPDSSGNLQLLPAGKAAGITVPPPSATTPLSVTESLRPPTANISVDETTPESGTSMPEVTTESVEETTTSPANITVNVTTTSPNGTLNESVTTIAPNATVDESSTAISLDTNTTVTPAVTTTPINEENVTLSNTTGSLESSSNESTTVSCASSPFAIEDMLVMSSRTRTAQQEVLNGAVLPQWRKVFGDTAENLTVTYIKDARRSSPPNVRDVQYRINGVGNCRLNVPQAMLDFHNNIANASIPEIAAVPESDGSLKFCRYPTTQMLRHRQPCRQF